MNLYDYKVKDIKGKTICLDKFKSKVILVINSATECGFTPQYALLQSMYEYFNNKGFEILDFPSNQFKQAPGENEEIHKFCTSRFGVTFPQFSKIEVNGENADPLFKDLVKNTKFEGFDMSHKIAPVLDEILRKKDKDYEKNSSIKWNFTKFLFDKHGNLQRRYEPTCDLSIIKRDIESIL